MHTYIKRVLGVTLAVVLCAGVMVGMSTSALAAGDFAITWGDGDIGSGGYYYSQLSNFEKMIYTAYGKGVKNNDPASIPIASKARPVVLEYSGSPPTDQTSLEKEFKVSISPMFQKAFDAYKMDNPYFFGVNAKTTKLSAALPSGAGTNKINVWFEIELEKSTHSHLNERSSVDAAFRSFMSGVGGTTNYDKLVSLHDAVVKLLSYNTKNVNDARSQEITSALIDNVTVCNGYAKLFKMGCDSLGITCVIVSGEGITGGRSENHAWNHVYLDGVWYGVDATWNDDNTKADEFFLVGSGTVASDSLTFSASHKPRGIFSSGSSYSPFTFPALSGVRYNGSGAPSPCALSVNANQGGKITAGRSGEYNAGNIVTLRAEADNGCEFACWSIINSTTGKNLISTGNPLYYTTESGSVAITAMFNYKPTGNNKPDYNLAISSGSGGFVAMGQGGFCKERSTVTLYAQPEDDQRFSYWRITTGSRNTYNYSNPFAFTMPGGDTSVTAIFSEIDRMTMNRDKKDGVDFISRLKVFWSNEGRTYRPTTAASGEDLSAQTALDVMKSAIGSAKSGYAVCTFRGHSRVDKTILSVLSEQAKNANINAILNFDTVVNGAVTYRISVDPSKVSGDLNVGINEAEGEKIRNYLKQWFDNDISVSSFLQKDSFGQTVALSIKLPPHMNSKNLHIYSYNAKNGTYSLITNKDYWMDENGYLVFNTATAGDVVISDGALIRK